MNLEEEFYNYQDPATTAENEEAAARQSALETLGNNLYEVLKDTYNPTLPSPSSALSIGETETIPIEDAIETTDAKRHEAIRDATISAASDWAKGAIAGAEEVGRAATAMGATLPPEALDKTALEQPELTKEQQKVLDWYEDAKDTFNEETTKPLVNAMALSLIPGVRQAGWAASAWFLLKQMAQDYEREGVSGVGSSLLDMAPFFGSYRMAKEPGFQQFVSEHPLRAGALLLGNEAPTLPGVVKIARNLRRKALIEKEGFSVEKAEEIIRKECGPTPEEVEQYKKKMDTLGGRLEEEFNNFDTFTPISNVLSTELLDPTTNQSISKSYSGLINEGLRMERVKRMQAVLPMPPKDTTKTVNLLDIYKTAESITHVGVGHVPSDFLGIYKRKNNWIRVQDMTSLETVAHEIGHALDEKFKITGADNELIKAAKDIWGEDTNLGDYGSILRAEGIAEFTSEFILNPKEAQKNFPEYSKAFIKELEAHPEIKGNIELLSEQVRQWFYQEPENRVRGNIQFAEDIEPSVADKMKNIYTDYKQAWTDSFAVARKTIKSFENDTGIKLALSDNPAEVAQAAKSYVSARTAMMIGLSKVGSQTAINALECVFNTKLRPVVLMDIYKVLEGIEDKAYLTKHNFKDYHEAFSTYITALHENEVIKVKNAERIEALNNQIKATTDTTLLQQLQHEKSRIEKGLSDYKTSSTKADNTATINNAPKEFSRAALLLRWYNDNLLELAVHYGFITAEDKAFFKQKYPNYVPLQRSFALEGTMNSTGSHTQAYANISKLIRSLSETGSTRTVLDPMTAMAAATQTLINKGERNIVGRVWANLADLPGGSSLLQEVAGDKSSVEHIFTVWIKGKEKAYQAIAPGVYEAVMFMDKETAGMTTNILSRIANKAATTLRIGATSTPMFTLWNLARDTIAASLYSETGLMPVKGTLDGFFKRADKEMLALFEAEGVPFSTFIGSNKDVSKMFRKASMPMSSKEKALSNFMRPIEFMLDLNESVEAAPRLAEFSRLIAKGVDPFEAGVKARDLTINFARSGVTGAKVNRYAAFFNAVIQGTSKFVRAFQEKPLETAAFAAAYITLPSLALWALNHDKDWYRDMDYKEKMTNWFLELNGVIFRIPKPELAGYMFGSVPERLLDYLYDNDIEALKASEMGSFLLSSSVPNPTPTALLPLVEWWANKSLFRGTALVSNRDLKKDDKEQYTIFTSEIAKSIGKATDLSPIKIDNSFKGVTGSMGSFFLGVTDSFLKENQTPSKKPTEYTRFTYSPKAAYSRTSDIFYSALDNLEKKGSDKRALKGLKAAKKSVDKLRKQYYSILNNPNLNGDIKRERLDKIDSGINFIQRKANARFLNYTYIKTP